jgi:hypothetical protein
MLTMYLLFAGLETVIYAGVALAANAIAYFGVGQIPFKLQFALYASPLGCVAAVIPFWASRFVRQASSLDRASA